MRFAGRLLAAVLVLLVASGAAGGIGTTIGAFTIGIDQSQSHSQKAGTLVPAGYAHEFDGGAVTGVTVFINNTGSDLTGEARVDLVAKDGTVVASATNDAILGSSGTQEILVGFEGTHELSAFSRVEITIASSL